ncbi:MAG: tetratricopeptide repeat protein, partial [Bacteriovorax sp.]
NPLTLVDGIKSLHKEVGNYSGLIPVVIKASDALMSGQHLNEALEVLTIGQQVSKNEYSDYFIMSRLAVVYEDLGQNQNAILTLEKMNSKSLKIFEGKNYLDLGRLYLKQGDKEKAKASFTYVVEKAKDDSEFVKIAKLYLSKI